MNVLIHIVLALHIIGIAALLGGFLEQVRSIKTGEVAVTSGMLHGAANMLITGIALVGLNQADDQEVNNTKIAVKLGILVVILALVYVKRGEKVSPAIFGAIGVLTAANIFIATIW
ncbi:hypothetical protein [Streptomyces profundus]|uniref:hypothetical protein n=1 Tax=Streptomyces profundus TaxID=2867410 RepID=UPI001D165B5F|nr:hypothetical protein [Streptomyces sp. MA3_2.13]UED84565.1 hypothetical protein K4G22_10400 [Streptomyces sp. MA3_2.13]